MVETQPAIRGGVLILQRRFNNVTVSIAQTSTTIEAAMGCDGGNVPIVLAVFEGNGSRPSHKGPGITTETDKMYTLNTTEIHGVIKECTMK